MTLIYPTLLFSANNTESFSWFDIKSRKNFSHKKRKKKTIINSTYNDTFKIILNLNSRQKTIINSWLNDCICVFNITNNFIKMNLKQDNIKDIINFYKLRSILSIQIHEICSLHSLNKHTADYMVKHCVEMYKSALSNHHFIDRFNIRNLLYSRRRKNLIIEPACVSSKLNSVFIKQLGKIKSNLDLNLIKRNSILQYDSYKKKYIIIVPIEKQINTVHKRYDKCGVDIGVRTFLTTYSEDCSMEIGTNCCKIIDRYNKRLDGIRSSKDQKIISESKKIKLYSKYSDKLKNKILDMHNKVSRLLLLNYSEIIIGKVSIKKMISNITSNLKEITKRRLIALSHYRFRMKLKTMASKYGNKIVEVDEYLTSKTCSECGKINKNLGSNKIFECELCKLKIDRDINASINIYKNENLRK
jgi:IS605 OrfB family transposase